jgi:hypothetical protein
VRIQELKKEKKDVMKVDMETTLCGFGIHDAPAMFLLPGSMR